MIYEKLARILPNATCVVEVGAHTGTDTMKMMAMMKHPQAKFVAFEADHRNIEQLSRVAPAWPGMFEIFPVAVSSENLDSVRFWLSRSKNKRRRRLTGLSSLKQPVPGAHKARFDFIQTTVQTVRLDTALANLGEINLLWADIQGGELDMLHGAVKTLPRIQHLYLEALDSSRHKYQGQPTAGQVIGFAARFGFRIDFQTHTDVFLVRR